MDRTPNCILEIQVKLEEEKIKNEIFQDRITYYISENLDLKLKIKVLDEKIDEFMKLDEKYRSFIRPNKFQE
jgi:hypothetical protein